METKPKIVLQWEAPNGAVSLVGHRIDEAQLLIREAKRQQACTVNRSMRRANVKLRKRARRQRRSKIR